MPAGLNDRGVGAKGLVLGGYGIANAARPAIGLALGWPLELLLRFLDRVGKGIRTAPREALIAGAAAALIRGRAFGFHSAMDNLGAAIGPLLAFALLRWGVPLDRVFLWSVVPGVCVLVLLATGIPKDAPLERHAAPPRLSFAQLDPQLRALIPSPPACSRSPPCRRCSSCCGHGSRDCRSRGCHSCGRRPT